MSLKLFALVVLAALAFAKAQSPVVDSAAAAPPTFEDLVSQQAVKVENVVQLLAEKSSAPVEVREAVLLAASEQLAACVAGAETSRNLGAYFACTGRVIKQAGDALSVASSGASASGV